MLYAGAIGSDVPIFAANGNDERATRAAWGREFKHAICVLWSRDVLPDGRQYCPPVRVFSMRVALRAAGDAFHLSDKEYPPDEARQYPCNGNCELVGHHADGHNCDLCVLRRELYAKWRVMADNTNFGGVYGDVVRLTKVALDMVPSGLRPARALHALLTSWQAKQVASKIGVVFRRKQPKHMPQAMVDALEARTKAVGALTALGTGVGGVGHKRKR